MPGSAVLLAYSYISKGRVWDAQSYRHLSWQPQVDSPYAKFIPYISLLVEAPIRISSFRKTCRVKENQTKLLNFHG